MEAEKTVTACVLIIGNEILSGRTQDVNLNYLAKGLNEAGVRLREARVIPDVADAIVATVVTTVPAAPTPSAPFSITACASLSAPTGMWLRSIPC